MALHRQEYTSGSPAGTLQAPNPVDAVIAWVDGADPKHAEKRARFSEPSSALLAGAKPTRFASLDEIIYCTLSILKFAPFFRRIFIITDEQIPPIFDAVRAHFPEQIDKIEIVDHKMLFRDHEHALPTFNSRSIETVLHLLPDLTERFVYFNDDFFLVRPVTAEDWFKDGKALIDGQWTSQNQTLHEKISARIQNLLRIPEESRRVSPKAGQRRAAAMAGYKNKYLHALHTPYARHKSLLAEYFAEHPDQLEANISYRFRSNQQFVPQSLFNHLAIRAGSAKVISKRRGVYTHTGASSLRKAHKKVAKAEGSPVVKFFCAQCLDQAKPSVQAYYLNWLRGLTAAGAE